jgi:hypothetical protein
MRIAMVLATAGAVCLGGQAVKAREFTLQLSPTDPKYNTPACVAARNRTYDGLGETATMALGAVSGMAGTLAERRRAMFDRQIELACMSNPPKRPQLEPGWTATKD